MTVMQPGMLVRKEDGTEPFAVIESVYDDGSYFMQRIDIGVWSGIGDEFVPIWNVGDKFTVPAGTEPIQKLGKVWTITGFVPSFHNGYHVNAESADGHTLAFPYRELVPVAVHEPPKQETDAILSILEEWDDSPQTMVDAVGVINRIRKSYQPALTSGALVLPKNLLDRTVEKVLTYRDQFFVSSTILDEIGRAFRG